MEDEIYEVDDFEYSINTDENGNEYLIVKEYDGNAAKLTIPSTVTIDGKDYPVTEIGEGTFYGCESLESVTIPNSVTEIGHGAFLGCKSLESVTIPNSVTEIGELAFGVCKSLKSVTIPNSVTEIGEGAFGVCKSLTTVTIPESVTKIGEKAFKGCISLKSLTIPDSVTEIGDCAFESCEHLTSIRLPKSWESKGKEALEAIGLDLSNPNLKITYGDQRQGQNEKVNLNDVNVDEPVFFACDFGNKREELSVKSGRK